MQLKFFLKLLRGSCSDHVLNFTNDLWTIFLTTSFRTTKIETIHKNTKFVKNKYYIEIV